MSKQANPTLIGAFVVGAVALTAMAVIFFGGRQLFTEEEDFIIFFEETVNGLDVGSSVKFKGVPIGQVSAIYIRLDAWENKANIPVVISINRKMLDDEIGRKETSLIGGRFYEQCIKRGLRAKLEYQSFVTGLLFVELDYYPEMGPPNIKSNSFNLREIPSISSGMNDLWKKASKALMNIASINFKEISDRVNDVLKRVDDGIAEIDFKAINGAFVQVEQVGKEVSGRIGPLSDDLTSTLDNAQSAFGKIEDTFRSVDGVLAPDSSFRYEFEEALQEFSEASQAVRSLANYLERNPNAILTGKKYPQ